MKQWCISLLSTPKSSRIIGINSEGDFVSLTNECDMFSEAPLGVWGEKEQIITQ